MVSNKRHCYVSGIYHWSPMHHVFSCKHDDGCSIYLTVKNASKLTPSQYTMDVQRRSIQLDIVRIAPHLISIWHAYSFTVLKIEHEGANYNFRISQLNGQVIPEKTKIKASGSSIQQTWHTHTLMIFAISWRIPRWLFICIKRIMDENGMTYALRAQGMYMMNSKELKGKVQYVF